MRKSQFLLGLHGCGVAALRLPSFTFWGVNLDDAIPDDDARNAALDGSKHPTLSRSVTFKPFEKSWDSLPDSSVIRDSEWTWRINVTNIADSPNGTTDEYIVEGTYDFTWPAPGNISAALDGATAPLCFTSLEGLVDLPVNITNAYEEDTGSDCIPVLGGQCVDAVLANAPIPGLQDCNASAMPLWSSLPECQDSFGVSAEVGDAFVVGTLGFNLSTDAKYPWESRQGFYWDFENRIQGTNSQQYHTLGNRLHIMMMHTSFGSGMLGPQLLCSRANVTKLPDTDPNGDGVTLTSEAVLESGAPGASKFDAGSRYLWAFWGIASLGFVAFC